MSYIYKVFEHLRQLWMGIVDRRGSLYAKLASARPTVIDSARPSTRPQGSPPITPDIYQFTERIVDDVSVEMIPLRYR